MTDNSLFAKQMARGLPGEPLRNRVLRYDSGSRCLVLSAATGVQGGACQLYVRRVDEPSYDGVVKAIGQDPVHAVVLSWLLGPRSYLFASFGLLGDEVSVTTHGQAGPRRAALPIHVQGLVRMHLPEKDFDIWPAEDIQRDRLVLGDLLGVSEDGSCVYGLLGARSPAGRIEYWVGQMDWDHRSIRLLEPVPDVLF